MKDLTLFDEVVEAKTNRDNAIQRAVEHADRVEVKWSDRAWGLFESYCEALTIAANNGVGEVVFRTEQFVSSAKSNGLPDPPDNRAFGAIILKAVKAGMITRVGYAPKTSKNCNCQPISVWKVVTRNN